MALRPRVIKLRCKFKNYVKNFLSVFLEVRNVTPSRNFYFAIRPQKPTSNYCTISKRLNRWEPWIDVTNNDLLTWTEKSGIFPDTSRRLATHHFTSMGRTSSKTGDDQHSPRTVSTVLLFGRPPLMAAVLSVRERIP